MADRVRMRIYGLMGERFLNRALQEGVFMARVRRINRRCLEIDASMRNAKKLAVLADKYRLKWEICGRRGPAALANWAKRRCTLPAAFLTAAVLSALFLSRVWKIDVRTVGNAPLPAGVQEALAEAGVFVGAYGPGIDTSLAEYQLCALPGCAYASVTRKGAWVVAEVAGESAPPELYALDAPRDLVAARDGVVLSVNVKSGTALIKPGDTVRRGQVLISGSERVSKEEIRGVAALGSVTARVWFTAQAQAPLFRREMRCTGRESTSTCLKLMGLELPMTQGEDFPLSTQTREVLDVGGLFLPLHILRTHQKEYRWETVAEDPQSLKAVLAGTLLAQCQGEMESAALENAEIIDKWTDFSMIIIEKSIRARAVLEVSAEIAISRDNLEEQSFWKEIR